MKRSKTQAERLLDLDRRIRNGEYPNCTTFAAQWEISKKTAQRDFAFLQDRMNAPLEYDSHRRGYFYNEPAFMLPAIQMNEGELTALLMGTKILEQFQGTPMAEKLAAVFEKLSALLPDNISVHPEELFTHFSFVAPPAMPISSEVWKPVVQGLTQQKFLAIKYGAYDKKPFHIKPLHLANLQGDWYLIVQYEKYDNFRQIALSRIKEAKLLPKGFDVPRDFDPQEFLSSTFSRCAGEDESFKVIVQFDKETAPTVTERQWHPNQTIKELKNGRVEISFEAKGKIEVQRWIMAFGRHAKVKSPKWLKERIAEEISDIKA